MTLRLAPDFTLPLEAVTSTFGLLAVRRAGKSNAAAVLAEEFFTAKLPFVVIDPKGDWYGLRSSSDGKRPGLAIPIFGGEHGDVPLERGGGEFLAELIAESRLSCVVDTSAFSEGDKTRFLIDFAERLYRKNREALHVILEEADDYIPQRPFREQARCVGAFERLVKRGGFRGLGVTLISQRSAALNKNVLTQVETLIVLRTTSPQDRKAIDGWIEHQGQGKTVLDSLPGLADGEAWVWSPHFLRLTEPKRVHFRRRATYDSGATPKATERRREPATLADVDLGAIRTKMAATIERAKAEDPRELRRQVVELKAQLAKAGAVKPAAPAPAKRVEKIVRVIDAPAVTAAKRTMWTVAESMLAMGKRATELAARAEQIREDLHAAMDAIEAARSEAAGQAAPPPRVAVHVAPTARPETVRALGTMARRALDERMPGAERKILTALAQYPEGRTKVQVAILTGYAHSGGGFNNAVSACRTQGWLEGSWEQLRITDAGVVAVGPVEPLPTGRALVEHWLRQLGRAERLILETLVAVYPGALSKEDLGEKTGYAADGGGFNNALSRLRTLELIEGRGALRARAELGG